MGTASAVPALASVFFRPCNLPIWTSVADGLENLHKLLISQ